MVFAWGGAAGDWVGEAVVLDVPALLLELAFEPFGACEELSLLVGGAEALGGAGAGAPAIGGGNPG